MQAFRLRGILPDGARFFSEDALCWAHGEELRLPPIPDLGWSEEEPGRVQAAARGRIANLLHEYLSRTSVRASLGLDPDLPIDLKSFHPVFRVLDGTLQRDLVVEVVQTRLVEFDGDASSRYPYRAGATLVVATGGRIRWCVAKPMHTGPTGNPEARARHARQQAFLIHRGLAGDIDAQRMHVDFAGIHGGL
jgi:hypothetical protein